MNKDEAFIRICADRQLSKSHTAQLMGFWPSAFPGYLEALGLGDINWCDSHQSLMAQQQRRDLHESRRGAKQDYLTDADRQRLRDRMRAFAPQYTAFGVTGTLPELVEKFAVVSKNSVARRINHGMSLEEALTTPRTDIAFRASRKPDNHPWRQFEKRSVAAHRDRLARPVVSEAS
ncbi:hypothetical protein [Pseudomonas koreensis]|uniref:hypothetical protein n=1 Tax=Pseudomonas koreensis TaxID=198620 RepID=UPI002076FB67|nr:hypothetical protein [Pseudomonas koreensis]MCM8743597.1 hypothetical protein [Pseudomonas koreensis]